MHEEYNANQITRKDARGCFVESLSDAFHIGKIHLFFASYDVSRPEGQRQTNKVPIYISADEFLELCRKLNCGELRYMMQEKKKSGDTKPLYEHLGGTSAYKLARLGRARPDGKSLSRTVQLLAGKKSDFLFVADSGPGEANATGLIVPKFGKNPENHVTISMSFQTLSELLLLTHAHYTAWLAAWYMRKSDNDNGYGAEKGTGRGINSVAGKTGTEPVMPVPDMEMF